ncbi:hypothetical protein VW212_001687 [Campylobacter upsaliensis]|uniref:Uncharacterized protein n=1 Tax=Campylobacter upsaliensis TaxID=28080 RepID=A0A7U8B658_CAMUP|nr:hypothetical protein [Campylobacter upsaliensis]EAL3918645.1 hypothetical protein [Campylobacter upsaliensis]EGL3837996.1 hypothetical protein [Campylobacter upsaliensis]EMD8967604.1 hypothetical protein [Campylobacter upsaliensis]
MYNYAKYENATRKEIIKALNLAEKKEKKLHEQLKENKEFFKFLQKKFNATFKEKREKPTKETLQALKNATSLPEYTNHEQLMQELQKEIEAEQ